MRRPNYYGYIYPLSGLLYCKDCGSKLHIRKVYNGKEQPITRCSNYAKTAQLKGRDEVVVDNDFYASPHRIEARKVMDLLKITLKNLIANILNDKNKFAETIQKNLEIQKFKDFEQKKKKLPVHKKRLSEINILLDKIYEDNALGHFRTSVIRPCYRNTMMNTIS